MKVEKKKVKLAGKGLPVFNEKFKTPTKDLQEQHS